MLPVVISSALKVSMTCDSCRCSWDRAPGCQEGAPSMIAEKFMLFFSFPQYDRWEVYAFLFLRQTPTAQGDLQTTFPSSLEHQWDWGGEGGGKKDRDGAKGIEEDASRRTHIGAEDKAMSRKHK